MENQIYRLEDGSGTNFFRWLFGEDFDNDFDSSMTSEQKEEYKEWLETL